MTIHNVIKKETILVSCVFDSEAFDGWISQVESASNKFNWSL